MRMPRLIACMLALAIVGGGCASRDPSQRIIFLDGASHCGCGWSVSRGMRAAGFQGEFRGFVWTSFLLWGADHLVAARSPAKADRLARQIIVFRHMHPDGYLALMGLSAGSAVILAALERLPDDVQVDYVVLFQPSVSASRDLGPALRHVKEALYATCSGQDAILAALPVNADGQPGPPAGRTGFRVPLGLTESQRQPYRKVVNVPWRPTYRRYGWGGGHTASTKPRFVQHVLAPRVLPKDARSKTPHLK